MTARAGASKRYDRGSGAIAALAVVAASVALTALVIPLAVVLTARAGLEGAADAAALAAADATTGVVPGEPCEVAARVARADGGSLERCEVDGLVVTVRVEASVGALGVRADATAGPAGAAG